MRYILHPNYYGKRVMSDKGIFDLNEKTSQKDLAILYKNGHTEKIGIEIQESEKSKVHESNTSVSNSRSNNNKGKGSKDRNND